MSTAKILKVEVDENGKIIKQEEIAPKRPWIVRKCAEHQVLTGIAIGAACVLGVIGVKSKIDNANEQKADLSDQLAALTANNTQGNIGVTTTDGGMVTTPPPTGTIM